MQTTAIPKNHMDIPWHEYSATEIVRLQRQT